MLDQSGSGEAQDDHEENPKKTHAHIFIPAI
jgi:hypothetical protein